MPLPNLFIPGGPKCGTTSLAAWLAKHPDVFISNPKEPGYFCRDYGDLAPVTTRNAYDRLYQNAAGHSIIGEATTFYLISETAIARILEYAPDAKFIVCLRNPVAMAQSMHSHWFRAGYEAVQDFEAAWMLIQERQAGRSVPLSCPDAKMLDYANACSMGEQVRRLLEQVPRKRVHFILLEDWCQPRPTWLNTLKFLGLKDDAREHFPIKNKGKQVRWPRLAQILSTAAKIRYRLGIKQGFGVMSSMARLNEHEAKTAPASPDFLARLSLYFAKDTNLLAQLSGRDLSPWMTTDAA